MTDSHRVDFWLVASIFSLLAVGLLMVFSSSALLSEDLYGNQNTIIRKHILHLIVALFFFALFYKLPLERLRWFSVPLLVCSLLLLVLVLIPGISHSAGGARRWMLLGSLRFQPGELVKLALVLYLASYIGRHREKMTRFVHGAFIPFVITSLLGLLLLLEPDFGTTAILFGVAFCQLLMVSRLRHLSGMGVLAGLSLIALAFASPYRFRRLKSFINPFEDPSESGYQLIQSLTAIGSGGVFGEGLGAGHQKLFYLPAAHTDFIFSVINEELGMFGGLFVLFLFCLIFFRGLIHARRLQGNPYLLALAVGCTVLLVLPAFLNISVALGLLPTKGLVLPLLSYGGSAMVVNLAAAGILLRLSQTTDAEL